MRPASQSSARPRYLLLIKNVRFLYSHFWSIATAVERAGWEVWIAAAPNEDPQRILDAGMKFVPVHAAESIWDVPGGIKSLIQTNRALRAVKPDLVHIIYLRNVLIGGILARFNRVPAVLGAITGLGSLFAENKLIYRILRPIVLAGLRIGAGHPNSVIALENTDDERLLIAAGAAKVGRTGLIPGAGVERDSILPTSSQTEVPVILCTCRMIRPKGIGLLLEAARNLHKQGERFELWLAGDVDPGNPQSLTVEELKQAEQEGHVKWLGHRTDIGHLLGESSIFCLPTYYREGLPRSLVEACAAGRAVVTTDTPGCRDVVRHNENGLLVPPREVDSLTNALGSLLNDPELRARMGVESRRRFEANFTLDAVLAAFSRCYALLGADLTVRTESAQPRQPVRT